MLNAFYMVRKYNLFDCHPEMAISLHSQLNIQKRRHDLIFRLKMQQKHLETYKKQLDRQIERARTM